MGKQTNHCGINSALFPLLGTGLVYGVSRSVIPVQMIGLYLMYLCWPPYISFVSLLQANTSGRTKKAVTFAIVNIGYTVGNLIGPQTFRAEQAPQYTGGVIAMMCCFSTCNLLALTYLAVLVFENKRRDLAYGKPESVREGTSEGLGDITDRQERESLRYTH